MAPSATCLTSSHTAVHWHLEKPCFYRHSVEACLCVHARERLHVMACDLQGQMHTPMCHVQVKKAGAAVTIAPATGSAAGVLEADVPVCKAEMDVIDSLLFPSVTALPPSTAALLAARTL